MMLRRVVNLVCPMTSSAVNTSSSLGSIPNRVTEKGKVMYDVATPVLFLSDNPPATSRYCFVRPE
eukprot:scaffold94307_cov58-Attheya_sp.AAC.1